MNTSLIVQGRRVRLVAPFLLAALTGCAQQTPPAPPMIPAAVTNPDAKLPVIPPDPLTGLDPEVRHAIRSGTLSALHEGITTLFPYDPHRQPVVNCQVLRVTELVLATDEKIKGDGAAAGDTERWDIKPVDGRVLLKPKEPGIATDLIVVTDRRSYHLTLRTRQPYMAQVAFYYPADIALAQSERRRAVRQAALQESTAPSTPPLNFNYRIEGPNVAWRPTAVFDDRQHTYIEFPENTLGADMPTLMVQNGAEQSLVNYQVHGSYYVADRLFQEAALTSGTGTNRQVVRINAEDSR